MIQARISTPDDQAFALYAKAPAFENVTDGLTAMAYTKSFPVLDQGQALGTLTLTRSLSDIYQGLFLYTLLLMTMGLAVWIVSFIFARSVHEKFSASFRHMIKTMKTMQDTPQLARIHEVVPGSTFEEIQFILFEFQRMTHAIFEKDQRLVTANSRLEEKVQERTRELKQLQDRLVEEAHKAGMADVATSVLHNFGNILSSISIDCSILRDMISTEDDALSLEPVLKQLDGERKLLEILQSPQKLESLRRLFKELEKQAQTERLKYQEIVGRMNEQLYLMKDLIYQQQNYATGQALYQAVGLRDILEQAFHIKHSILHARDIKWSVDVPQDTPVLVQKTKFLHVFANLIVNAMDAMKEVPGPSRRIEVHTEVDLTEARIHFRDFGPGIPKVQWTRIFTLGFTTKSNGHGFGLHSSANYMREMQGNLELGDPQPSIGAGFVVRLKRVPTAGG